MYALSLSELVLSILLSSFFLKIRDSKIIAEWNKFNFPKVNHVFLYGLFLALDVLLISLVILGRGGVVVPMLVLLSVFFSPKILGANAKSKRGCPCFGALSLAGGYSKDTAVYLALTALLIFLSNIKVVDENFYEISILSMIPSLAFMFGQDAAFANFSGKRISPGNADEMKSSGNPVVFIFLSTKCPICMAYLKYLGPYSKAFSSFIDFRFYIDGYLMSEDMNYGGGIAVCGDHHNLKKMFSIDKTPSVVIHRNDVFNKFVGVNSSILGIDGLVIDVIKN